VAAGEAAAAFAGTVELARPGAEFTI
jgi:hypothetical protein